MSMRLWEKITNLRIMGKLRVGPNGGVILENADRTETSVSNTEFGKLSGLLASSAELNRAAQLSTRIVSSTAATLAITLASHDSKVVVLASTHTQTLTLPVASGSGAMYHFVVSTTGTDGSKVIKVGSTLDNMTGQCVINSTSTTVVAGFLTTATDDTITLNNNTTGGILGTEVEIIDVATNIYKVRVTANMSGSEATPFSATV